MRLEPPFSWEQTRIGSFQPPKLFSVEISNRLIHLGHNPRSEMDFLLNGLCEFLLSISRSQERIIPLQIFAGTLQCNGLAILTYDSSQTPKPASG